MLTKQNYAKHANLRWQKINTERDEDIFVTPGI